MFNKEREQLIVSSRHGISLKRRGRYIRLEFISENSPFFNMSKVGDIVVKINNITIVNNTTNHQIRSLFESEITLFETRRYRNVVNGNNTAQHDTERSFWNVPCEFGCGYKHFYLSSNEKTKCCVEGRVAFASTKYPVIKPLPSSLLYIFQNTIKFSTISSSFNNILAMGATGVDNGKGGGFERDMHGNHAVKLNGRTYHFFPPSISSMTDPSGGLSYFMFDAQAAMMAHANSTPGNNGIGNEPIDDLKLMEIYNELKSKNYLCQELEQIGAHVVANENTRNLMADINSSITYFEVASIVDDSVSANRIIRIKLKDATYTSTIPLISGFLEPISYPIFFLWRKGVVFRFEKIS